MKYSLFPLYSTYSSSIPSYSIFIPIFFYVFLFSSINESPVSLLLPLLPTRRLPSETPPVPHLCHGSLPSPYRPSPLAGKPTEAMGFHCSHAFNNRHIIFMTIFSNRAAPPTMPVFVNFGHSSPSLRPLLFRSHPPAQPFHCAKDPSSPKLHPVAHGHRSATIFSSSVPFSSARAHATHHRLQAPCFQTHRSHNKLPQSATSLHQVTIAAAIVRSHLLPVPRSQPVRAKVSIARSFPVPSPSKLCRRCLL